MGSKDNVAKHVTVKRNLHSLRICGIIGRQMGDEELDPVFIGANNKTVIAFNSTSTYLKVRTVTLYRENKSSSYQAIFKASGKKQQDNWIPVFLLWGCFFFFLSVCL